MIRLLSMIAACLLGTATCLSAEAMARPELRTGWRDAPTKHIAALQITLADGWKTYWRVPGDAGIPPVFNWSGSRNVESVTVEWPTPKVFRQSGFRSVGYDGTVVLPLVVTSRSGGDITLRGEIEIGICKDVCVPFSFRVDALLPADDKTRDARIDGAMAALPFTAREAGITGVRCSLRPDDGGIVLRAEIDMPSAGGREETAIETGNPLVWVTEPRTRRSGGTLVTEAHLSHIDGKPFAVDRSALRITVLGRSHAVDVHGCR